MNPCLSIRYNKDGAQKVHPSKVHTQRPDNRNSGRDFRDNRPGNRFDNRMDNRHDNRMDSRHDSRDRFGGRNDSHDSRGRSSDRDSRDRGDARDRSSSRDHGGSGRDHDRDVGHRDGKDLRTDELTDPLVRYISKIQGCKFSYFSLISDFSYFTMSENNW